MFDDPQPIHVASEREFIRSLVRQGIAQSWQLATLCALSRLINRGSRRYLLPDGSISSGISEEDAFHEWIFSLD